jgi:hypothetical protein
MPWTAKMQKKDVTVIWVTDETDGMIPIWAMIDVPRNTMSMTILCDAPDTILPIKKMLTPNKKTGFRPKMSANLPYRGWKHVFVSM